VSRQRLNAELDNVRRALEWFVERGDAEAALSLSVGTGWLFFTRADFHQAARWVADALGVPGDAPNGLRCLAHAWHGYFRSFVDGSATHVAECEAAARALRADDDDELRADTLLLTASTLNRARRRDAALDVLERSRPLLERIGDPWRLGLHGLIGALTLENSGRLDDAELAARDSARRFGDVDDEWWIIEPLGILAGIAEDRGDLDGAADAYEEVVESCRAVGGEFFEPRWLSRLASVRARQGNDSEADRLYRETITNGRNPLLTASALLARARVVRRLGDLEESRRLLDDGMARYELLGIATGCAAAFAGLAWWALAVGDHAAAAAFAEQAGSTARATGDAHSQLVADSVLAAVAVVVDPSGQHRGELAAIAQRRAFSGGVYAASLDELDVFSLAERYPPVS
jgi:tetratricopeptide (TPR) repeat protein